MAQSFFSAAYRFAGSAKAAPLPQWLADSLDDRFEGDLGLIQTTRLAVHQTKVRLTAAAIDAIEHTRGGGQVPLEAVDAALIRSGLETCIGRHAEAWRHLCPREPVPSFAWAFDLHAAGPAEPAFMQCPEPSGPSPVAEARGLKLLPDFGFAVPSLVPADGPMQRACQLMAFAGKQFYVKGQPTGSRPLSQVVAIDVPGRPAWRFRHEVETCLGTIEFGREQLGLRGGVVFAWLLPFLPAGRPIPRELQHPCLLDVGSPLRLRPDGRIAVYSRTCRIGGSDMQLGNAALGPRDVWPAAGLPGIVITTGGARKREVKTKAGKTEALQAAGLDAKPAFVQRPFGKVPSGAEIVELIGAARLGGGNAGLGAPVLDIYRRERGFDLPEGAELVVEGEPIGASTTATWLEVRIPLPDPAAGAETVRSRWVKWQQAADRQVKERARRGELLRAAIRGAYLRRHQGGERAAGRRAKEKAGVFARTWDQALETATEGDLWRVAAASWDDLGANERAWSAMLDSAEAAVARAAFDALGGFDDPATVLAAAKSGLLHVIEHGGRRPA